MPGTVLHRALQDLGLSSDAARAVLARLRRNGDIVSRRWGRGVAYRLAGPFATAFERLRGHSTADPPRWTGAFHAVLYQVPERHRPFRDALRRAAQMAGYGLLTNGVLIAVADRGADLAGLLESQPADAQVWLTTLGMGEVDARRAAGLAWDLPSVAADYRTQADRLATRLARAQRGDVARKGGKALRDFADTLLPALPAALADPGLPAELLPPEWPGAAFARALERYVARFGQEPHDYLNSLG